VNDRHLLNHPWLIRFCQIVLALIFISAAIGKILDTQAFIETVTAYQILPKFLITPFGHFIPWLEFTIGLTLLIDRWPAGAVFSANLMLMLFIVIVLISLLRGLEIDCGCFAIIKEDSLMKTLIRDFIFMVPALILLRWHRYSRAEVAS